MYHSISHQGERQLHPYYRTITAPEVFEQHLQHLHSNGYRSISLAEATAEISGPSSNGRLVSITFDDGYADSLTNAFPAMKKYGYTGTVFLPTAYIGNTPRFFKGKRCLTWREARELQDGGIAFGSHTITHRHLDGLSHRELESEIVGSKLAIEDKLGCPVDSFAYPFAFCDTNAELKRSLSDLLRKAGYRRGVCTSIGTADGSTDSLFMKRLPMNSCDDPALFQAKLAGAYDWLAKPQYLVKLAKQGLLARAV